jgi:hypothetical protein
MKSTANNTAIATAMGLDVGTSRIVVARSGEDSFRYESQLNAFCTVPYSKMTAKVMEREKVPHTVQGELIIVHGNESEKFADMLNAETRRTMTRGVMDAREPESLNLMRAILSAMLGKAATPEQKICFTVPAAPLGEQENLTYHEATLRQILEELGYSVTAINEGLAVVYAELEASNYTGIGVSCGGGLCNVCVSYLSVPVVSFSIPKAGDYIDSSAATVTGERSNRIRIVKEETFHFNGAFADKTLQVLGVYYDEMIRALVAGLNDAFAKTSNVPKFGKPIPLVLSGGTTMPPGFRDRFEKLLREQDFPVQLSEVRLAEAPLYATAKGALVAALTD